MEAPALVSYRLENGIATITLDDGKMNALSPRMLAEINAALDRAVTDRAVVVLTGRQGVFSAGFDLRVLKGGGRGALGMVRSGFELAARLLSFPAPVVVACSGHAIAMGLFVLQSADYRVGAAGAFKFVANEVALGLAMPRSAVEICRQRLTPSHFNRAMLLSEPYTPESAIEAGMLDRVVPEETLAATAQNIALEFAKLDRAAHCKTKLRVRAQALRKIRLSINRDIGGLVMLGVRSFVEKKLHGRKASGSSRDS